MILSEFIRLYDLSWTNFLWGLFWLIFAASLYTFAIVGATTIGARQAFIKNELPKVHDNMLQKERDKNKILKMEIKILKDEKEELIVKCENMKVRFGLIKTNFEEGLKG